MLRPIAALLVLAALLLPGCLAPAVNPTPPTPPRVAISVATAEGGTVTRLADGVQVVWQGSVVPPAAAPVVGSLPAEPPSTPAHVTIHNFTLAPEVTIIRGSIAWQDPQASLGFRVRNATNNTWCAAPFPTGGAGSCYAPLDALRNRTDTRNWRVWVFGNSYNSNTPPAVPYTITLVLQAADLPMLGPPVPYGGALQFAPPVLVSKDKHSGEPSIAVTQGGKVYVAAPTGAQQSLWRTTDGTAFTPIPIHSQTADPGSNYPFGGGDSDVATAGEQTIYFADQQFGNGETVSSSHDGGATWFTQPLSTGYAPVPGPGDVVPVSPPAPLPGLPGGTAAPLEADRQWLVTDGDLNVWLAFNSGANGISTGRVVVGSKDGGHTFPTRAVIKEDNCFPGPMMRAVDGTLYVAGCNGDGPGIAVSTDGGLTFTWHLVAAGRNGQTDTSFCYPCHLFPVVTTDAAGNVYYAWSDETDAHGGLNIWMGTSKDKGTTWSKPTVVNTQPGTYVQPWITAGAAGRVALAYYGTKFVGNPEQILGEWYVIVANTQDALAEKPVWSEAPASPDYVQYGPICMRGALCGNGRNLLDFIQIQADKGGNIHLAYTDGRANYFLDSLIRYARQMGGPNLGGPSVDKSGGK